MSNLPPLDPDVRIPAAIRAAAARSNAIHKAAYEPEATAETQPKAPDPQPQPKAPEPQPQPKQQEAQPEPKQETQPGEPENYEHMYKSLKGRFDKQSDTMRGLTGRIAELEALVSRPADPPQQPASERQFTSLVTEQERADYGTDFIDVAQRAAREKLDPEIAELRNSVKSLSEKLGGVAKVQTASTEASMHTFLTEQMPNWRELNRDENFLAWVNLPDPFSGGIRLAMMRDAYAKADGQRVLRFFKGYLADEAATAPANDGQPTPTPNPGKVPLASFAAPGRAKAPAAASAAPGEKETISRSQIANFYRLVQKGHYRGNEAEKDKLEKQIFEAERDGRVID